MNNTYIQPFGSIEKELLEFGSIEKEIHEEIEEAFRLCECKTDSHYISVDQLKTLFALLGFKVTFDEIKSMLYQQGYESSSKISLTTFKRMVEPKILSRNPDNELDKLFELFDEEGDGFISFENLKHIAMEVGKKLTDEQLHEMIDAADNDRDDALSRNEFKAIIRKKDGHVGMRWNAIDELSSDEEY